MMLALTVFVGVVLIALIAVQWLALMWSMIGEFSGKVERAVQAICVAMFFAQPVWGIVCLTNFVRPEWLGLNRYLWVLATFIPLGVAMLAWTLPGWLETLGKRMRGEPIDKRPKYVPKDRGEPFLEGVHVHDVSAVCFDAFGTLVEIGDKRWPFRRLIESLEKDAAETLRHRIMREPLSLDDFLDEYGQSLSDAFKQSLRDDLQAELASIRIRPHMLDFLQFVRDGGHKIGVCSNLALPYGPPMLAALPIVPDAVILSYEVGTIKPEREIYERVVQTLDIPGPSILFTGDSYDADFIGPQVVGMQTAMIQILEKRFVSLQRPWFLRLLPVRL